MDKSKFERKVSIQSDFQNDMQKIFQNLKKERSEKRTNDLYSSYDSRIEKLYSEYLTNDEKLRQYQEEFSSSDYWNARTQTKELNKEIKEYIKLKIDELKKTRITDAKSKSSISEIAHNSNNNIELSKMIRRQFIRIDSLKSLIDKLDNEVDKEMLHLRENQLNKIMEKINDLNEEIILEASEQDLINCDYFNKNVFNEIQDKYEFAQQRIKNNLRTLKSQDKIALPELKIPMFNGEYTKWMEFQDLFVKIIHENKKLSCTEKIRYLKTSLIGEAANQIQHIEAVGENYDISWQLLRKRYENKRIIISQHSKNIFGLPKMQENSVLDLKRLHNDLKQNLWAIRAMQVKIESWNAFIIPIFVSKFDIETLKQYEHTLQHKNELETIEEFLDFIERRYTALEAIQSAYKINKKQHQQELPKKSFFVSVSRCTYCLKENHMLNNCFRFKKLNVLEKIQFVNIHQLCRNCLKSQHPIKSCKEKNNCKECNGQHNTLLHTENNEKQLKTYFLEKQESTFLATALVKFMSNNQDEHVLRALIDSGSQATFITEDAVQMLRLRKTRTITQITGIGESNKATSTSMVKLTIKPVFNSEFTIQINAFVLKKLTGVLPEQKFETNEFEQFQHLQLADPCLTYPKKLK